jgi:hypothetical protein
MVKKFLIAVVIIWLALIVLMPKTQMYYKLEETLAKQDVKMNERSIKEGWFSLDIKGLDVYAKGIKMATVEEVNFFTLLFYTDVNINGVVLDDLLKGVVPTKIDEAQLNHAIWDPMHVNIDANGAFGSLEGKVMLGERNLRLDFNDSKGIENLQSKLKKDEKGWYYETSF